MSGPAIPPPHQLSLGRSSNGSLVLYWRPQELPHEIVSHNFSYVVWLGTDKHLQANTTQRFETASTELALPAELSGRPSYAAVTVQDWHGYRSAASETLDLLFLLAPTGGSSGGGGGGSGGGGGGSDAAVAGESPHVYVAVAVVVVAALAAALAVLLVRQRRLQRSFVNFVNPHYDTRSGAATFTDQTLGKTNKYKQKNAVFTFF